MAVQRSGSTCRAMQAVFFMHKREGGGEGEREGGGGEEDTAHIHHPVFCLTKCLMFCDDYLSVSPADFCHDLSV